MRNPLRETGLAGWGGRIRTSEWRNQNPTSSLVKSTYIPKKLQNSTAEKSITWTAVLNGAIQPAFEKPCADFASRISGPKAMTHAAQF
jgi:hypothetical protein